MEEKSLLDHEVIYEPEDNTWTPLHTAAKRGYYKFLETLIKIGAFLDSTLAGPKQRGFTPLHLAAQENHAACAKLLLKHGASISSKIEGVCDPIHLAVFNNHVKMTSLLLDHGAGINLRFSNKFFEELESQIHCSLWLDHNLPLLHYSILRNFIDMTKLLITHGADVNLKSSLNKTTLMQAVEVRNHQLVHYLLKEKKVNVNDRDIFGQPVLHFLILNAKTKESMYNKEDKDLEYNKFMILCKLCKYGVDLNARFPANEERSSIIHYMIKYGFYVGVDKLLSSLKNFKIFNEIDLQSIYSAEISSQHITPDIESDDKFLHHIKNEYSFIVDVIVKSAIRHQLMGIPFDKNLILEKPIHKWYSEDKYKKRMKEYRDLMIFIIRSLQDIRAGDTDVTAWHLITCKMNELVKLMSIKIVIDFNILDENRLVDEEMMDFVYLLNSRLRIARKRKQLLEDCAEIFFNLLVPYLPYHCCETIIDNLDNNELIILHPTLKTTDEEDLCDSDDDDDDDKPVDL